MSSDLDPAAFERPTIVEVWAPSCSACRAMQADLDATAVEFSDTAGLVTVNAAVEAETVRKLGVRGTPTLIGIRNGEEVFRFTGRQSRADLRDLFAAVSSDGQPGRVGRQDLALRVGAGAALAGVGLAAGPAWPLLVVGSGLIALGGLPWLKGRM